MHGIDTIFYILVLVMSVVVHEVSHGVAADRLGDPTARFAGRLSLNPLIHLDWVGSVFLPILLVISGAGFIIGWAKPVPYNERNLTNKRWGSAIVAGAGIFSNICLAVIFGLSIRLAPYFGDAAPAFIKIASAISEVNLLLALFNLIPIPPLDGSKVLFAFIPRAAAKIERTIEYLSLPLLILFIFFLWPSYISPFVNYAFTLISGIPAPF